MTRALVTIAAMLLATAAVATVPAAAANCAATTTGSVPLPALGRATYKGEQGGLYRGGTNEPPTAYAAAGRQAAAAIVARDATGAPSESGKAVLLSIGMSNTTQEFSRFVTIAKADAVRDAQVVVVDGAQGGQDARVWADPKARTWTLADDRLRAAGVTAAQVQAVWIKQAVAQPKGDFATSSGELERMLDAIVRNAAARYPNIAQVFLSSRTYAGYAITTLNPEPYAYESAFAVKRLVDRSVQSPDARPWIGWGPYLWADGATARADGLTWTCADVADDGVHPSAAGQAKVAQQLQAFFNGSEFTGWYRGETAAAGVPAIAAQVPTSAPPTGGAELSAWILAAAAVAIGGAAMITLRLTRRPR